MGRSFKNPKSNVLRWTSTIRSVRARKGLTAQQYPDAVLLSLINIETNGDPKGHRKNSQFHGLLQQGTGQAKDLFKKGFTKEKNTKSLHGNPEKAIEWFFEWMEISSVRKNHQYNPEYIAIVWKGGGGTLRTYKKKVKKGGYDSGARYLASKWGGSPLTYLKYFQEAMSTYTQVIDDDGSGLSSYEPEFDYSKSYEVPTRANTAVIGGNRDYENIKMSVFDLQSFVTPEELRRGIVAQIYHVNEWYLKNVAQKETIDNSNKKNRSDSVEGEQTQKEKNQLSSEEATKVVNESGSKKSQEADNTVKSKDSQRVRYLQSLVDAEFYKRRFNSRSIPAVSGPFNPYPVSGFTGLVMTPGRPIIGYVESVIHNINVAGGTASTSVSMSSPRYWDEGEVWYWAGGEPSYDDAFNIFRNFPPWHNRLVVPTNNCDSNYERNKNSKLDDFYTFMIGCSGVEYYSNHTGAIDQNKLNNVRDNLDVKGLEFHPETLQILEYNKSIAETDKNGRFKPGTLAHKFYGNVKAGENNESKINISEQNKYNERYGIREKELLVDFLGNQYDVYDNVTVLTGPTFGNKGELNALQKGIIEYIKDLEERTLDGGV